jgi:hypothetical protein
MNIRRTGAQLCLLPIMQSLLETEVVELTLKACVLAMAVILSNHMLLEILWFVYDNLTNTTDAPIQAIWFT